MFDQSPDYAAARRAFRAAITIAPEWGEPYYLLGLAFERQGKVRDAMAAYEQAIRFDAGPRPLIALGWMKRLLSDIAGALECFQSALALNCHVAEAEARLLLAECYECAGRTRDAVRQWQHVAAMTPTYPAYEQPVETARAHLARYAPPELQSTHHVSAARAPSTWPALTRRRSRAQARSWQIRSGT